jgi:hypothetical protein
MRSVLASSVILGWQLWRAWLMKLLSVAWSMLARVALSGATLKWSET